MSAASLEADLLAIGIECTVEAHDRLAVLIPARDSAVLRDAQLRRAAIALLPAHGFTHLALELTGSGLGIGTDARSGSDAGVIDGAALHRD